MPCETQRARSIPDRRDCRARACIKKREAGNLKSERWPGQGVQADKEGVVLDEVRYVGKQQVTQGFINQGREFEFYSS